MIGLACAAALSQTGREVLVLEKNGAIGEEVSARNSEVIHAGIYYPPGSLKARLCVEGRKQLYAWCTARNVAHRRLGKLIVANSDEDIEAINRLYQTGLENGVDDLVQLSATEAMRMEPALQCISALYSPSTGIVDSHGLMLSLLAELENHDGVVSYRSHVESISTTPSGVALTVESDGQVSAIETRELVNCAGLDAVALARRHQGIDDGLLPKAWFSKGNYFKLRGRSPFNSLIYPAPVPGGLGIHLVLDLEGNARFGPDVEEVDDASANLDVDSARVGSFIKSVRRYWPEVDERELIADYAGIRPKTSQLGSNLNDFQILGPSDHGAVGVVHCLGMESPGLTSCLAIAEEVVRRLQTAEHNPARSPSFS